MPYVMITIAVLIVTCIVSFILTRSRSWIAPNGIQNLQVRE